VDLKPEEVKHEWHNDQANDTCCEVLAKVRQSKGTARSLDVEEIPEINHDWNTNREESECTHVFGRNDTAEAESSKKQPFPPLATEWSMAEFVKSDVAED